MSGELVKAFTSDASMTRGQYLVQLYRADHDVLVLELMHGPIRIPVERERGEAEDRALPACRCQCCGGLLTHTQVIEHPINRAPVCFECVPEETS